MSFISFGIAFIFIFVNFFFMFPLAVMPWHGIVGDMMNIVLGARIDEASTSDFTFPFNPNV